MKSRERLMATLNHQQPDRVPVDFGATAVTGISARALIRLREALNLQERPVRIHNPFQMLGIVEQDVLEAVKADVVGLWNPKNSMGFHNDEWKPWQLSDGSCVLIGGGFTVKESETGDAFFFPGGDASAAPSAMMPKGGYYFDHIIRQEPYDEDRLDGRRDFAEQFKPIDEPDLRIIENQARSLFENTQYGIVGNISCGGLGDLALLPGAGLMRTPGIRKPEDWYIAHALHPQYIHEVFALQTEIAIVNLARYHQAVGERIQVVFISGTDFGTQRGELMSPDMFREFYKPYFKRINDWVHRNTGWKTFYHTCGSIVNLLDDIADMGVDVLNPVQCSAVGMDPTYLKSKYGERLTFWGGGIDTQGTLPFGTPADVREEALDRLRIFSPCGGYVFNAIHNIQHNTPIENILALFEAVRDYNENESPGAS